ncbi:hypothetical protein [Kitasatospora kifunensis]|uniref:Uncharacterized protein n=1 Tax=Kitasatospora kifunensis TaxID=58351 RepID=A0A7W7VWW4_KITKI|nr:hypothetical protein [Kitasatospora kifunensis]MBB4925861.1 hypothetical protein [Kitasatospora kifunensis]
MTISSGSWAAEPDDDAARDAARLLADRETGQGLGPAEVFEELDFLVYGVNRAGRGLRGSAAATPSSAATSSSSATDGSATDSSAVDSDAMSAYESQNGELCWVELCSGDWTSLEGPYVTVRTYQPGVQRYTPLPELEELVERERDRVYEQLGIDEGDSPGQVRALREWISVEGEPVAVQIHEERGAGSGPSAQARTVWAGRLLVYGSVVLICGRGIGPADIELSHLRHHDYERFTVGRAALLRQVHARRRERLAQVQRSNLALTGLDAHRALLEFSVERALAHRAHRLSCGRAKLPRRLRVAEPPEQWEAAVRQQMRYAGESRVEAGESIGLMVAHLLGLAERAQWLVGSAQGRAALEELIRYTVFASQVPSLPAHLAWAELARSRRLGPEAAELAERAWLAAWERWRRERNH